MDLKNKAVLFDGRCAHATEEFTGTRFTVTFYAVKSWEKDEKEFRSKCGVVPWVLPTVGQIESVQSTLPVPEGYKQGPAHVAQTMTVMKNVCQWEIVVKQTPWMKMARGICRKHRRGAGAASTHVLSVDLTGPHPAAIGTKFIYALVAVYYVGIEGSLPYVQGLTSKKQ